MKHLMVQKYQLNQQTQTTTIALGWNSMLVGKGGIGNGVWQIVMPQTTG
jgi:hypothetical protein